MATVSKWTPFGVALDLTATAGTVTRTSATKFTVKINVSWETYWDGANTIYGMTASSGGQTVTLKAFNGKASSGSSGSLTGTYSISGNASATKTIAVTFKNFNTDNGDSATKTINLSVNVPALTSYKVTYNANGGSGAPSSQTKWKDQTLTLSSTKPTRSGYTFKGWSTSSSGSVNYAAGASYTANASVTLYAVWQGITYKVTYNANGGTGAPAAQTKTHGVTLKLSSTKPTKTNYTFKGWGTSASATTVSYAAGANYTANANITLYALWGLAYTKPRITNFSVSRADENGNINSEGTHALVQFSWACDQEIQEACIEWKLSTNGAYSVNNRVDLTSQLSGTSGTVVQCIGNGEFSIDHSYTIRVTVTDSLGTFSKTKTLSSLAFTIHGRPGGNGIAFGKMSELDGYADFTYEVVLDNNKRISGRDPSGNIKEAFQPQNENGNTVVGWGNYNSKSGNTNIYGYDVIHGVSNIPNPGTYRPYRRQGDTLNLKLRTAGYVTNAGKDVTFWIPLTEPIVGSPTVTIASNDGFTLRQGNAYTHGSSATVFTHPDSYEATATMFHGIYVRAVFSNTTNVTNNDTIGIYWSGTITFS